MSKRLNIVLPERSVERLEALKERTQASSATEVIKHALMTYESIANHLGNGDTFYGSHPNGESFSVEFMIDVQKPKPTLTLVE